MSEQLDELLANLRSCDLKMVAFDMMKKLGNGLYPEPMTQALQLFGRLPCPETGVILIAACPEAAEVMALSNSGFARNLPTHMRGPHYDGLDEWMASFDQNLRTCDAIHKFLLKGANDGTISVGFHRMRDQQILFDRLEILDLHKGFFTNGRQFLRDKITRNISAFRSVVDQICVHGIDDGRERFWNALGAELDPQWHLDSEMQYDLSVNTQRFAKLVHQVTQPEEKRRIKGDISDS